MKQEGQNPKPKATAEKFPVNCFNMMGTLKLKKITKKKKQ
jgi:hypothetical protein